MKDKISRLAPFAPFILAFAILVLICGLLLGFLYLEYEQEAVQRVNEQGFSILNQADNDIQNLFSEYTQTLHTYAAIPAIINNNKQGINILTLYYEINKDKVRAITRIDRNGTILYTIPENSEFVGSNLADQPHVQTLLTTHKPVLSDIFPAVQGYDTISYLYPVFKNGIFDGSIAVLIPFNDLFEKKLSQIELSKAGKAWLISGDGTIVYSPYKDDSGHNFSSRYNETPSLAEVLHETPEKSKNVHTITVPGSVSSPLEPGLYDVVHKHIPLVNTSWHLFIITPRKDVVAGMQGYIISMILIIVILASIISLFLVLLNRQQNQIRNKKAQISLEQAISREQTQLVSVLESMESLVYVIDPSDYTIIYANPKTKMYFGEDIVGKLCHTVFLNADTPCSPCHDKNTVLKDEPDAREIYLPSVKRHFQTMSKRISWQSGGDKVLSVMNDITEEKELEGMVHQARNKLVFLNSLTGNEILNQIFIMAGYLEVAREAESQEQTTVYLKKCHESVKKVEELVRFLKTYQGLGQSHPRWQSTHEVFLLSLSHLSSGSLTHSIQTGNLQIYADPLLELAFEQLIENSLIHGGGGESISLSLKEESPHGGVILVYTDKGHGIPADSKEKIFGKGFGTGTGPGLGLFLVKEILSITGIEIIENGVPGSGAQFEIRVPPGGYRYGDPSA